MALVEVIRDDFKNSTVNAKKWDAWGGTQSNGELSLTTTAASAYFGISYLNQTYDLVGSSAFVKVVTPLGTTYASGEQEFKYEKANGDAVFFNLHVEAGVLKLSAYKVVAGTPTSLATVTWNASTMAWWRLRESGGTTYWEYSADCVSWTTLHSVANPFTLTAGGCKLDAGQWAAEAGGQTVKFSNFNVKPTSMYPINLTTSGSNTDATSYTTASVTATSGRLVLIWVYSISASAPNDATVTGSGLSGLTKIGSQIDQASTRKMTLYKAYGTGSANTIGIAFSSQTQTGCTWSVVEFPNATDIVQYDLQATAANATSLTSTLGAFTDTNNITVGGFGYPLNNNNGSTGDYFIDIGERIQATPNMGIFTEWAPDNRTDVTVDISASSTSIVGISAELTSNTTTDITKSASYVVKSTANITKSAEYVVNSGGPIDITKTASYAVATTTSPTKSAQYLVGVATTLTKTAEYKVLIPSGSTLTWKGYTWTVRDWAGGPGFSTWATRNVLLDEDGYLRFRITNPTGSAPIGSEINSYATGLGYGTYTMVVGSRLDNLDKNAVWGGFFPYYGGTPLIEFDSGEVSKWDNSNWEAYGVGVAYGYHNTWLNGSTKSSYDHYPIGSDQVHTFVLKWEPGKVTYDTYIGTGTGGTLVKHSEHTTSVPVPSSEQMIINFWTYDSSGGTPDAGDTDIPQQEVIVRDLTFIPQFDITKTAAYNIRKTTDLTKSAIYVVKFDTTITKSATYVAITNSQITKSAQYLVRKALDITKTASYNTRKTSDLTKTASYVVNASTSITKSSQYTITSPHDITKSASYALGLVPNLTLDIEYFVRTTISITKTASYTVAKLGNITKTAQYVLLNQPQLTKSATYTVLSYPIINKPSGYEVQGNLLNKQYVYKVYSSAGAYLSTWDDVISDHQLSEEINTVGSVMEIDVPRKADDFGEGLDIDYANRVEVLVVDKEAANGLVIYTGYIAKYNADYNSDTIHVTLNSYGADLGHIVMESTGDTTIAHNSKDPSQIIKDILDAYGGDIGYTTGTIDMTGTTVSYTFNTNTVKEGIDKCVQLAPAGWYYYIDQATNLLHFHELSNTPDHVVELGRNIETLSIDKSIEPIVNTLYFSGGGDPAFYKKYTVPTSITNYGVRAFRYKDSRVTLETTADIIANRVLQGSPEILVEVTIIDSNLNDLGYDIESINIGETIKIGSSGIGASSLYDIAIYDTSPYDYDLTNLSSITFQVTSKSTVGDKLTLSLSTTPPDITKRISDIYRNLKGIENDNNPTAPI